MPRGVFKRKPFTKEHIRNLSLSHIGKKLSEEAKRKVSIARKGKLKSEETKRKMSESSKGKNGSNWQGGIGKENELIRKRIEFRLWREAVYSRDNWTCFKCKIRGGRLHPHHIKNFAQYPELRFSIDNGITFCKDCHIKFHHLYGRKNNNIQQLKDFEDIYKRLNEDT